MFVGSAARAGEVGHIPPQDNLTLTQPRSRVAVTQSVPSDMYSSMTRLGEACYDQERPQDMRPNIQIDVC